MNDNFQDSFADQTENGNQELIDVHGFGWSERPKPDMLNIKPTNLDKEEIEFIYPLLVTMANENRVESDNDESCGFVFDETLCDVAEMSLQTVDWENPDNLSKLLALMIHQVRDLNWQDLVSHLSEYSSEEIERLGLNSVYSASTYRKTAKALQKEGRYKSLIEATFVAVHAVWWMGVELPESAIQKYEISYERGPDASDFNKNTRNPALWSFVNDLVNIVVANLSLQRSDNASRDLRSLLGAFAHAAYTNSSFESYGQTAQHTFDLDTAMSGPMIRQHIDRLDYPQIKKIIDDINQALLQYVVESGFVTEPVLVSYDLTYLQSLGNSDTASRYLTEDGRWEFASLSLTDSDLEFAFGLRLLNENSQRAPILGDFLRRLTSIVDVEMLLADAEFNGKKDFENCRDWVPHRWAIKAKDIPRSTMSDFDKLDLKLDPGGTDVVRSAGFKDLKPTVSLVGCSTVTNDGESIRRFYTDINIPHDEQKKDKVIRDIDRVYKNRAKIEAQFGNIKNELGVTSDTDKKGRKLFYSNISSIFYNIYKIVNSFPEPKTGLRFDPSQKEVLNVIRHLTLGEPIQSDEFSRLLEDE